MVKMGCISFYMLFCMLCNACALDRSTVRPTEPVLDLQRGVEICNLLQSSSTSKR